MFKPKGPQCQSCSMPLSRDEKGGGTEHNGQKRVEVSQPLLPLLPRIKGFYSARYYAFADERACSYEILSPRKSCDVTSLIQQFSPRIRSCTEE